MVIHDFELNTQNTKPEKSSPISKCGICGRTLTDPLSVEAGVGPVCAGKAGAKLRKQERLSLPPCACDIICCRTEEGFKTNVPHAWKHHSPSGMAWGYGGSGPADLALNILLLFT